MLRSMSPQASPVFSPANLRAILNRWKYLLGLAGVLAAIAGLPIGMASYLLANRLIPADAAGRADAEVATMFYAWGAAALLQLVRPARQAWTMLFAIGALVFAAVPVANALTTTRGLLASWKAGDDVFVGFDLAMLAIAALLAVAAWRAGRPQAVRAPRRTREMVHV